MINANRVKFQDLDKSNLIVDTIYEAGTTANLGSEVLSRLTHVANTGGFRKCKN